jgi:hypothetical protein
VIKEKRPPRTPQNLLVANNLPLFPDKGRLFLNKCGLLKGTLTSIKWVAIAGMTAEISGFCMFFETCERSYFTFSVSFEGFSIVGVVLLNMVSC